MKYTKKNKLCFLTLLSPWIIQLVAFWNITGIDNIQRPYFGILLLLAIVLLHSHNRVIYGFCLYCLIVLVTVLVVGFVLFILCFSFSLYHLWITFLLVYDIIFIIYCTRIDAKREKQHRQCE